jgi:hypothetical protein
MLLCYLPV